jgi:hypothetical protein
MVLASVPKPQVEIDIETGEVAGGQLMFGISVPRVSIRRDSGPLRMTEWEFNHHEWRFAGEGDKLTAVLKDGEIVVRLVAQGVEE